MEPMTNMEALAFSCGEFHYEEKHYVMLEKPFTYTAKDIFPYYTANAICEQDACDEEGYRPVYTIRWIVTNEDQLAYIAALMEKDKAKAFELSDGDILFARTGATVGKSYLVESAPNNAIFASYLIRVQYSHSVIPQYIKFFFESGYYWEQISSNSVGVGQPNVNGTSLGKLRIPLPPAAEQKRISEEAHRWMGVIDSLEFEAQHLSEDIGASKKTGSSRPFG